MLIGNANLGMMKKGGVNAVKYNGTTDYLDRGSALSGVNTVTQGVASVWIRIDGGNGTGRSIYEFGGVGWRWLMTSGNFIYMTLADGLGNRNDFAAINGGSGYSASANWLHCLFSWQTQASRTFQSYINDVSDFSLQVNTGTNFTMPQSTSEGIGAFFGGGSNFWNGCMAELYIAPNQYLDLSVTANRRKFISAAGKPVFLGADGSLPTGTAPAVYLTNPAPIVGNNAGTGGNFTIHGSPSVASTSPG